MKPRLFVCLALLSGLGLAQGKMDTSIGGLSVDKYHESKYDSRSKLYLFSGGD